MSLEERKKKFLETLTYEKFKTAPAFKIFSLSKIVYNEEIFEAVLDSVDTKDILESVLEGVLKK